MMTLALLSDEHDKLMFVVELTWCNTFLLNKHDNSNKLFSFCYTCCNTFLLLFHKLNDSHISIKQASSIKIHISDMLQSFPNE